MTTRRERNDPDWAAWEVRDLEKRQAEGPGPYLEFFAVPALSAGLYVLEPGGVDRQQPHGQDEMYSVIRGKARFWAGDRNESLAVGPGSVLYVKAGVEHKFFDVEETLSVLVFFAPAEEE